jgi:hypothetical protein
VPLTLTAEERATLEEITARFPSLVDAVERQFAVVIEDAMRRLRGFVITGSGVDYVLERLVDRVIAAGVPEHAAADLAKDGCAGMMLLIARNAAGRVRADVVRRLLGSKRN